MRTKVSWKEAIERAELMTGQPIRTPDNDSLTEFNAFLKSLFFYKSSDHSIFPPDLDDEPADVAFIEVNQRSHDLFYQYFLPYVYSRNELYAFSYDEDDFIEEGDTEVDLDEKIEDYINDESARVFGRLYSYLKESQDYYSILLEAYETMKSKLYDSIVSKEGISMMPQSATMDTLGSTSDDLSRAVIRKDDGGTAMQRLAEIQSGYRSIFREWAEEMEERFILWR